MQLNSGSGQNNFELNFCVLMTMTEDHVFRLCASPYTSTSSFPDAKMQRFKVRVCYGYGRELQKKKLKYSYVNCNRYTNF